MNAINGGRLDIIAVRDSDGDTTVTVFLDGKEITSADFVHIFDIDPGRSGADHGWWRSVSTVPEEVPEEVVEQVVSAADSYHEHSPECDKYFGEEFE